MESSPEKTHLRQQIHLHKLLNRTDQPVRLAEEAIKQSTFKRNEQSQTENFLRVTLETDSPDVVLNWLAYQKSRKGKPGVFWHKSSLAEKVSGHIERELLQTAKHFARNVYGQEDAEKVKNIHMHLIRLYAGYLKRWFAAGIYKRGGSDDLRQ